MERFLICDSSDCQCVQQDDHVLGEKCENCGIGELVWAQLENQNLEKAIETVLKMKDDFDKGNLVFQTHSPTGLLLCAIEDLREAYNESR